MGDQKSQQLLAEGRQSGRHRGRNGRLARIAIARPPASQASPLGNQPGAALSFPEPPMRTQVAILGAGPAGLFLSLLLDRLAIDSVIVEPPPRQHIEER